ncbi:RES family NAD+ phosphorylase [Blastococcus saxobsidens]|uniref:RES domain-containing protein n=1 Tax=Blastococcus saxobsidens (strain DD2) TaxID=1146883 RepID=H6RUB1_BLASD|nr:RES family NAD+ phosphorylase [Blastococcus saxobsidens]CCG05718.1 conserved protein of unknown function [Blastococcus saxobsidens DD2]
MVEPASVFAPPDGIWRVGRGDAPHLPRRPADGTAGDNRFDSQDGTFNVLYFATTLDGCFGETLARFRPAPHLRTLLQADWRTNGFMEVGAIPADWRFHRTAVRVVEAQAPLPFLDIDAVETLQFLRYELALGLGSLGVHDLDTSVVRGGDRRITRLISSWTYNATDPETGESSYAGIRYASRLNSQWECWAVFDRVPLLPLEFIPITPDMPSLRTIAQLFDLRVH